MIDLSRRSFFKGLAATLVATAALPKIPLEYKPAFDEWIAAVGPIYAKYVENVFVFGVGALVQTCEFPFVRSVDPREIIQDTEAFAKIRGECDSEYGHSLVCLPTDKLKGLL